MKIATIIVRILLGLLYAFFAAVVLFHINLGEQPAPTGTAKTFMEGMMASVYLLPLIKITELICGIALITGLFAPLATVIIFPVSLNILFFHLFVAPDAIAMAIFIVLANLFLAYAYRDKYKPMLKMK
jgi:putative oxidoreductase